MRTCGSLKTFEKFLLMGIKSLDFVTVFFFGGFKTKLTRSKMKSIQRQYR